MEIRERRSCVPLDWVWKEGKSEWRNAFLHFSTPLFCSPFIFTRMSESLENLVKYFCSNVRGCCWRPPDNLITVLREHRYLGLNSLAEEEAQLHACMHARIHTCWHACITWHIHTHTDAQMHGGTEAHPPTHAASQQGRANLHIFIKQVPSQDPNEH